MLWLDLTYPIELVMQAACFIVNSLWLYFKTQSFKRFTSMNKYIPLKSLQSTNDTVITRVGKTCFKRWGMCKTLG